ncbi:MAG: chemotaxis protein CheW [Lacrimispora sp.]|uniref:chemotaxis protein CheW n=1 Tax=Lacrimispora sp. TaxID=2719234 RepID=UPI0039E52A0A
MQELELEKTSEQEDTLQGKYLTFSLGERDLYGMDIRYVTEIIGMKPITQVPEMPEYMKGIMNLRGKIIPIMDVRKRFGREEKAYDERTCIIVLNTDDFSIGLIVDRVDEVLTIQDEEISPLPDLKKGDHGYIKGIGKTEGRITLLLDCKKVLNGDELVEVNLQE